MPVSARPELKRARRRSGSSSVKNVSGGTVRGPRWTCCGGGCPEGAARRPPRRPPRPPSLPGAPPARPPPRSGLGGTGGGPSLPWLAGGGRLVEGQRRPLPERAAVVRDPDIAPGRPSRVAPVDERQRGLRRVGASVQQGRQRRGLAGRSYGHVDALPVDGDAPRAPGAGDLRRQCLPALPP